MKNLSHWRKLASKTPLQGSSSGKTGILASGNKKSPAARDAYLNDESFRRFFEMSPIPMVIDDVHQGSDLGFCLQVNDAFKKLFGYSFRETHRLSNWFRLAFPDVAYRKKIIREWLRDIRWARKNEGVMPVSEDRIRAKNGRELIVEVGGVILGDYLLTTFVDLTEKKKIEDELKESEERFRTIFENMPTPAAHVDYGRKDYGQNTVFLMNQAVHRVFGYKKSQLPNVEAWMKLAYPDPAYRKTMHDRFFGQVARLKKVGDIMPPMEFRMRCADGSDKVMLWTGCKMPRGFFAMSTDLTDLRKAEAKLHQMVQDESERLQQKLQTSVVASAVAHEVNQPLSEILIKSQLILQQADNVTQFPRELRVSLESLVDDARRVEMTIERMRALLRNVPIQKTRLDLRNVIDSSALYLKRPLKDGGIRMEIRMPATPVVLEGDASQLQLAVSNLLRNALEAIVENPAKKRRIRVRLGFLGTHVEIKVADSGPGVNPAIREQIFSPLASTRMKGAGLGLYLVKTTVLNHGGEGSVKNSDLGGAEFCIRLPVGNGDKGQGKGAL